MMSQSHHISDDEDRRNRFLSPNGGDNPSGPLRERAASQPPRCYPNSPSQPHIIPSTLTGTGTSSSSSSLWSNRRSATHALIHSGLPQSVPTRASSFSNQQVNFSSAMRESRAFASTFEDDESEAISDTHDEFYLPSSMARGRTSAPDSTRSRSQSLATTRPGPIGSPYQPLGLSPSWHENSLSNPRNISRYGEIRPPGSSRPAMDASNMSPFVRDVGQILLDDGSPFHDLWSGMNPQRDENGGGGGSGGSGTTSRRHSVSVVQPRRGGNIVGFNAPGTDGPDESMRPFQPSSFDRGGLMLSDDDLASDLNMLSLNSKDRPPSSSQHPPSQPASLPIYLPLSRSPPSDRPPYQSINLSIPPSSFVPRQTRGSPSDSGLSASGSPTRGHYDPLSDSSFVTSGPGVQHRLQGQQQQQPSLTARFVPGQGIQYLPPPPQQSTHPGFNNNGIPYGRARAPSYPGTTIPSPISPTGTRPIKPQQPPYYPQQMQRRPSDAAQSSLAELGKGVPLHAVPASWPLYIVEFKAGRTDLFYLTDLSLDIRVGDLVIVEADRGKDLGKVVNDTITLAEVEAFQKQQQARIGFGDGQPMSPGGNAPPPSGKKEINPKMIYGKAQQQDTQLLVSKMQDEVKALQLCQSKVRAKKLPMEVIDAEYQWDRRKLTFYFIAEKRIDFRELVRELFRLYKTRIWMASLQGSGGYDG